MKEHIGVLVNHTQPALSPLHLSLEVLVEFEASEGQAVLPARGAVTQQLNDLKRPVHALPRFQPLQYNQMDTQTFRIISISKELE